MVGLKKGQTNSGSFKKGRAPWNKRSKGITKAWNKGKKCPQISKGLTGRKLSKKTKIKISKFQKGKISHRKGLSLEEEYGIKKSNLIKKEITEKVNLAIKEGRKKVWNKLEFRTPYPYEFNNQLKKQIRHRDNYECQLCKINQEDLNEKLIVHHIDFDKNNNSEFNLISVCRSCHGKVHCFNNLIWRRFFQNVQIKKLEVYNGR